MGFSQKIIRLDGDNKAIVPDGKSWELITSNLGTLNSLVTKIPGDDSFTYNRLGDVLPQGTEISSKVPVVVSISELYSTQNEVIVETESVDSSLLPSGADFGPGITIELISHPQIAPNGGYYLTTSNPPGNAFSFRIEAANGYDRVAVSNGYYSNGPSVFSSVVSEPEQYDTASEDLVINFGYRYGANYGTSPSVTVYDKSGASSTWTMHQWQSTSVSPDQFVSFEITSEDKKIGFGETKSFDFALTVPNGYKSFTPQNSNSFNVVTSASLDGDPGQGYHEEITGTITLDFRNGNNNYFYSSSKGIFDNTSNIDAAIAVFDLNSNQTYIYLNQYIDVDYDYFSIQPKDGLEDITVEFEGVDTSFSKDFKFSSSGSLASSLSIIEELNGETLDSLGVSYDLPTVSQTDGGDFSVSGSISDATSTAYWGVGDSFRLRMTLKDLDGNSYIYSPYVRIINEEV